MIESLLDYEIIVKKMTMSEIDKEYDKIFESSRRLPSSDYKYMYNLKKQRILNLEKQERLNHKSKPIS